MCEILFDIFCALIAVFFTLLTLGYFEHIQEQGKKPVLGKTVISI